MDPIMLSIWKLMDPSGYSRPSDLDLLIPLTQETVVELSKVQG